MKNLSEIVSQLETEANFLESRLSELCIHLNGEAEVKSGEAIDRSSLLERLERVLQVLRGAGQDSDILYNSIVEESAAEEKVDPLQMMSRGDYGVKSFSPDREGPDFILERDRPASTTDDYDTRSRRR